MVWDWPLRINFCRDSLCHNKAPTLPSNSEIKDSLDEALRRISRSDKIILLGDFNTRVGQNSGIWNGVIGKHGIGQANSNGIRLLSLCSEHNLTKTNTIFQQKAKYKTSWMHPRWAEHFNIWINQEADVDHTILGELPEHPQIKFLNQPPTFQEVRSAVRSLKNKTPPWQNPWRITQAGGLPLYKSTAQTHSKHLGRRQHPTAMERRYYCNHLWWQSHLRKLQGYISPICGLQG